MGKKKKKIGLEMCELMCAKHTAHVAEEQNQRKPQYDVLLDASDERMTPKMLAELAEQVELLRGLRAEDICPHFTPTNEVKPFRLRIRRIQTNAPKIKLATVLRPSVTRECIEDARENKAVAQCALSMVALLKKSATMPKRECVPQVSIPYQPTPLKMLDGIAPYERNKVRREEVMELVAGDMVGKRKNYTKTIVKCLWNWQFEEGVRGLGIAQYLLQQLIDMEVAKRRRQEHRQRVAEKKRAQGQPIKGGPKSALEELLKGLTEQVEEDWDLSEEEENEHPKPKPQPKPKRSIKPEE